MKWLFVGIGKKAARDRWDFTGSPGPCHADRGHAILKVLRRSNPFGNEEINPMTLFADGKLFSHYTLAFYKQCNAEYTNEYLAKIRENYAWFKSLLK